MALAWLTAKKPWIGPLFGTRKLELAEAAENGFRVQISRAADPGSPRSEVIAAIVDADECDVPRREFGHSEAATVDPAAMPAPDRLFLRKRDDGADFVWWQIGGL